MAKLIVGNWKMNGLLASLPQASAVAAVVPHTSADRVKVVICPPATLIGPLKHLLCDTDVEVGGQDCHSHEAGAHTGDISAQMLADAGATYVIVGHSERRADHMEASETVSAKAVAAVTAGLTTIICVGETRAERESGQAQKVVLGQLAVSIPGDCDATTICIAYEPVWAIGTGLIPTLGDVEDMHSAIRSQLVARFGSQNGQSIAILYGGSVNAKNAADLLGVPNVDGALVGGASLTAESFLGIIDTQL